MKKIVLSTIFVMALSSTSIFAAIAPSVTSDAAHSVKSNEEKLLVIVDNKDRSENKRNGTDNRARSNDDQDDNKSSNEAYEPQCDTPVWAMCTRRKKKHDD